MEEGCDCCNLMQVWGFSIRSRRSWRSAHTCQSDSETDGDSAGPDRGCPRELNERKLVVEIKLSTLPYSTGSPTAATSAFQSSLKRRLNKVHTVQLRYRMKGLHGWMFSYRTYILYIRRMHLCTVIIVCMYGVSPLSSRTRLRLQSSTFTVRSM